MQSKIILVTTAFLIFSILGCGGSKGASKVNKKMLYGLWKVTTLQTAERRISGEMMGNLQVEFTKDGYRIKTLDTEPAPPPDSTRYLLKKGEITYPDNEKLPPVSITMLTSDSLTLKSEKVEWRLHK